ncbi:MAG: PAS domain-containing protein [Leptospiraceae bacterium]|nr:PAS domain-containing protein [Leptospiraceae bacterium]
MENQIILLLDKDSDRIQTLIKDLSSASFTIHFTSDPNLGNLQNGILKLADILLLDIEYLSQFNDSASVELFLNSLEIPFLYTTNNKEFKIPKELEKITSFGIIDTNSPSSIIISSIQIAANQYSSHEKLREKEKSLTESVELLQNILDCSTDFIFVKDKNLRTILCNEMVAKAVGKKASELIGHNDIENGVDIELVKGNPEKGIRGYENDDLAALNGETISNQADYVYSGNDIFVFDTVKRPLRNRKGEIIGLFGISRDITARKNAENLLASERERLAITLHSIGDGVISTNVDGKILMFNKAAEDLTGWNSQIALGQSLEVIFKLVEEQTHSIIENPVEKVLRTRERIELSGHTNLITKNGKMKIISYTADPICDTNNKILGLVIVFRDMTEKIKLEASIQRNQKLESVGILAGGIAHDFNNLLAGIFGYLEIALLFSKENPKVSEYLNKAMTAFSRAKALTLQLLTFSKGGNPIKKMGSLVPILKSNIQFTLSGSNISVEYDLDENLMITEIDENQIGQVIDNIAINALQAMPNGGKLLVKAENVVLKREEFPIQNNQNFVKISFKDTGIGIPKEIIQRIFDPFFSAKKTEMDLDSQPLILSFKNTTDFWKSNR